MSLGYYILLLACGFAFWANPRWRPVAAIVAAATLLFVSQIVPAATVAVGTGYSAVLGRAVGSHEVPLWYALYDLATLLVVFIPGRRGFVGLPGSNRMCAMLCCFIIANCSASLQLKFGLSWPFPSNAAYDGAILLLNLIQALFIVLGGLHGWERSVGDNPKHHLRLPYRSVPERRGASSPVSKIQKAKTE